MGNNYAYRDLKFRPYLLVGCDGMFVGLHPSTVQLTQQAATSQIVHKNETKAGTDLFVMITTAIPASRVKIKTRERINND